MKKDFILKLLILPLSKTLSLDVIKSAKILKKKHFPLYKSIMEKVVLNHKKVKAWKVNNFSLLGEIV